MSRTKQAKVRKLDPDPKYKSVLISRLVNRAMRSGKKSVCLKQVYGALELVEKQTKQKPLEALESALEHITPQMEVRSRRVGGAAYQVPTPVRAHRATSLAIRWLVMEANKRPNKEFHSFAEKLSAEIVDALHDTGGAIQKKINAHKMADANKAFAHFRW